MTKYRVRPGRGSDQLIVEFISDSTDRQFLADLRDVFARNGVMARRADGLVFRSRVELVCGVEVWEVEAGPAHAVVLTRL